MTPPTRKTPHYLSDEEIPKEIFEGECCCTHDVIHGYRHGFVDGYAAGIEQAEKAAEQKAEDFKKSRKAFDAIGDIRGGIIEAQCATSAGYIAKAIRKLGENGWLCPVFCIINLT